MERIINLNLAERQVLQNVKQLISESRNLVAGEPPNLEAGVGILNHLRAAIYEDLNQIQHEAMILRAARLQQNTDLKGQEVDWYWNPRQRGTADEPDLRGVVAGRVVVSAEITASERPIGSIDKRMGTTLERLSKMSGRRMYFVRTDAMEDRARTKVKKGSYQIEVRRV
jgi:hypothetical protein